MPYELLLRQIEVCDEHLRRLRRESPSEQTVDWIRRLEAAQLRMLNALASWDDNHRE